jgi:Ser/Thr protein kinase RdoA (MazF antagonist)
MRADFIASQFAVPGRLLTMRPFGAGNINHTYLGVFRDGMDEQRIIIQEIRREVFPQPERIMHNLRELNTHFYQQLGEVGQSHWRFPEIIKTKKGEDYILEPGGNLWRALTFVEGAHTFEVVQSLEHAHEAGSVLGEFHTLVDNLSTSKMQITLPGFHHTSAYLKKFQDVLNSTTAEETSKSSLATRKAIEFIQRRAHSFDTLEKANVRGELKTSITHGDPKLGNVMIDILTGKGVCLIDLDTVQPGLTPHDFGDAARSICNPAGEESTDVELIDFDCELFQAFYRGYSASATETNLNSIKPFLWSGIHTMTLELGLRFLIDHLEGDVYFKVQQPGQNLHRAWVQFKLTEKIEQKKTEICRLIDET